MWHYILQSLNKTLNSNAKHYSAVTEHGLYSAVTEKTLAAMSNIILQPLNMTRYSAVTENDT